MEQEFSVLNISTGKTGGLPFQTFCLFRNSTGTTQKVKFRLFSNGIFQNFFVNGKQPQFPVHHERCNETAVSSTEILLIWCSSRHRVFYKENKCEVRPQKPNSHGLPG